MPITTISAPGSAARLQRISGTPRKIFQPGGAFLCGLRAGLGCYTRGAFFL